jgi:Glycosyl transferase family 2/Glycosyl transferases group 1
MQPTVCFVSASRQNVFFAELLDALANALVEQGIAVERAVDYFPELRDELVYVFVPHELLPLLMPDGHPSESQLQRSVTICTEQPGTHWFDENARISMRAAGTIDINRLGVAALKKLGVDARFLQLGYTACWDHWHGERDSERPVELAFLAGVTPRRLTAIARCARHLAGRPTELHLPEALVPHQADSDAFLSGARKWEMLSRSKLLMNIHRSELGYFEWQRAIEAMVNGCVLLSEHSLGFEPLIPGEHFVSVSFDSLDVALEALLDDEDRWARMRMSAYEFLRDEHPLSASIEVLAEAVSEVASHPIPTAGRRARQAVPRPKPPQIPLPEYERIEQTRTELDSLRMATKQLLLDQRETRRALRDLQLAVSGERRREDAVERLGVTSDDAPLVSVVITVYNYAPLVGVAIDSVAASEFTDYELVIVDDASTDGSGDAIRTALARAPWVTAKLITRPHNEGLARARNLGAESTTGELLFILDADNAIYPHALGRLVQAMDETSTATFAYGIIEQFNVDGPSGLMSYLGWDPRRLRYGNFVDAMAMVRRSALLEVGGYVTDPRLHGWEDFALWCTFADRGWSGVRVPEIVARYRLALHSMISVTNIDASAAWSLLLDRFACLSASAVA